MVATVYEELVDFLVSSPTPEKLAAYRPSESVQLHVEELIRREKSVGLTDEETSELNNFMCIDHLLRMAKARARQLVDSQNSHG